MDTLSSPLSTPLSVAPASCLQQVFLLERDSGLLCRLLGLYAARGIDVRRADYDCAASDVMTLKVSSAVEGDAEAAAETMRVLLEKAATLVGVLVAAAQPAPLRPAADALDSGWPAGPLPPPDLQAAQPGTRNALRA